MVFWPHIFTGIGANCIHCTENGVSPISCQALNVKWILPILVVCGSQGSPNPPELLLAMPSALL